MKYFTGKNIPIYNNVFLSIIIMLFIIIYCVGATLSALCACWISIKDIDPGCFNRQDTFPQYSLVSHQCNTVRGTLGYNTSLAMGNEILAIIEGRGGLISMQNIAIVFILLTIIIIVKTIKNWISKIICNSYWPTPKVCMQYRSTNPEGKARGMSASILHTKRGIGQ